VSVTNHQRQAESFAAANLECAKIIIENPVKYPPDSMPAIWAAMVLNPPAERTAPVIRRAA
jgi:hypothetical protein